MEIIIALPGKTKAIVTKDNKIVIQFEEKDTKMDLWINQFSIWLEENDGKTLDYKTMRVSNNKKLKMEGR